MATSIQSPIHSDSLADVLERILDKGVVIAGDVTLSLVGIELLSIKLRLLITTVDKAVELGINWWEHDPALTGRPDAPALAVPGQEAAMAAAFAQAPGAVPEALAWAAPTPAPRPTPRGARSAAVAAQVAALPEAPAAPPASAPEPPGGHAIWRAAAERAALDEMVEQTKRLELVNRDLRGRLAILEKRLEKIGA